VTIMPRGMNDGIKRDTNLEQHELVERVIPLHQEDVGWHRSTEVHVIVIRVGYNAAAIAAFRVCHLR